MTKYEKLNFIINLLEMNPSGLSEMEIAKVMNTGRRNVNNWLRELEGYSQVHRKGRPHGAVKWFAGQGD